MIFREEKKKREREREGMKSPRAQFRAIVNFPFSTTSRTTSTMKHSTLRIGRLI